MVAQTKRAALSACTYSGIRRLISCIAQVEIYISYTKWPSIVRSQGTRFYMLWHLWLLPPSFFNFGSTLMLLSGCLGMQHVLNVMSRIKLDYIWPTGAGQILKFYCTKGVPYKINKHDCSNSAVLSHHSSVDVWYCDLGFMKHPTPYSEL